MAKVDCVLAIWFRLWARGPSADLEDEAVTAIAAVSEATVAPEVVHAFLEIGQEAEAAPATALPFMPPTIRELH